MARRARAEEDVSGYVHSVETGGTADGPGVRFVVFLSGCALRCVYCHNPDALQLHDGKPRLASDVVKELGTYAPFLRSARGGLTLSGGEPLLQRDFSLRLFQGAKKLKLHTALDTSGFLGVNADDEYLQSVDLVLLDIKAFTEATYQRLTGAELAPTLRFAERLAALKKPVWLRYVLVPGWTDGPEEIDALAEYAKGLGVVQRVDVLPFHKLGEWKWKAMKLPYQLADTPPPTDELLIAVRRRFRQRGLETPGTKHPPSMSLVGHLPG